jgi:hypothetical protein
MDTNDDGPIPLRKPTPPVTEPVLAPVAPVTPIPPIATPQPTKGSWGSLLGIILIVFLITLAAFYSWGERLATQSSPSVEAETVE